MTRKYLAGLLSTLALFLSTGANADECLVEQLTSADNSVTVAEIKARCASVNIFNEEEHYRVYKVRVNTGLISQRVIRESRNEFDDYVIIPPTE